MFDRISIWSYLGFVIYLSLYMIVCQSVWHHPPETPTSAIFKVLPVLHLIFVIYSTGPQRDGDSSSRYRSHVVSGLLCSAVGDVMMVWRYRLFAPGLLAFGVAHAFYIRAFGFRPLGGAPTMTSCAIVSLTSLLLVGGGVASEGLVTCSLVCLYHCVITVLTWRAVVAYLATPDASTLCACAGAALFAASDFLLAYDRWRRPIEGAAFYIHALYYVGQMMISTSVLCYEQRQPIKPD